VSFEPRYRARVDNPDPCRGARSGRPVCNPIGFGASGGRKLSPKEGVRALQSYAVADPLINEVIDLVTGRVVPAAKAIGADYDKAIQQRLLLRQANSAGAPLYACVHCAQPVVTNCMHQERRFYFRHAHDTGECTVDTRNARTPAEIDALRYDGAKESAKHKQMKAWIAQCLARDGEFADIETEKSWRSTETGRLRRPDVRATYRGMPIAFEVQLSSTYVQVIAERRQFYLQEGALLFWVFAEFNEGMRKLTQDDIFFNNNQNAFLVTAETVDASMMAGTFLLESVWRVPTSPTEVSDLQFATKPFSELRLDQARQQAYFYDFYGELEKIKRQPARQVEADLESQRMEFLRRSKRRLRTSFERVWLAWFEDRVEDREAWHELGDEALSLGFRLPSSPIGLPYLLINIVYSMKLGRAVHWNYKLIQVAHLALPGHDRAIVAPYLRFVWRAIKVDDRAEVVRREDTTGKWAAKIAAHRAAASRRVVTPPEDPEIARFLEFLFPELAQVLAADQPTSA
jgi:hypothetical protein